MDINGVDRTQLLTAEAANAVFVYDYRALFILYGFDGDRVPRAGGGADTASDAVFCIDLWPGCKEICQASAEQIRQSAQKVALGGIRLSKIAHGK